MNSNIVKFPFSVSRRAYARKPRTSDNGTPEERAERAAAAEKRSQKCNPLRAKIVAVSRATTIAGRVIYQSRDLSRIGPLGKRHAQELRSAAKEARYLASKFERAAEQLGGENHQSAKGTKDSPGLVEFLQKFKAYFMQEFARGRTVDQIFDDLEGSYSRAEKALRKP